MTDRLKIAIAQLNPVVGDIDGNVAKLLAARDAAPDADIICAGELVLSGYPPEDLVLKPVFMERLAQAVDKVAAATKDGGPAVLVTVPWRHDALTYNAVVAVDAGEIVGWRAKVHLPNTHVFDEVRTFAHGPMPGPLSLRGVRLGVPICEDIWHEDVVECLQEAGAELLIVPNGSPWEIDKHDLRLSLTVSRVTESGLPMIYINQVGGQDELVFDGASFALNADRSLAVQCPSWQEAVITTEWRRGDDGGWHCDPGPMVPPDEGLGAIYQAMTIGLRDYVDKNRFPGVVLGLSGGIDSALSAAVAVDALGPDRVHTIMMPSPYTSQESLDDAAGVAEFLGIRLDEINIGPGMQAVEGMVTPLFNGAAPDTTEENIQSRLRGLTLMAISNKLGPMVLSTGNKSEMAVGYATLYGDMCGGYSVLKDVYKSTVFALSRWRNQHHPEGARGPAGRVMPERVIDKPPSAELKPDQTDQDTLPPYDELDDILERLIEHEEGVDDISGRGHDPAVVRRVWRMLDLAEYKRRQAPPGVKITPRSFGKERRYPITNRFRNHI